MKVLYKFELTRTKYPNTLSAKYVIDNGRIKTDLMCEPSGALLSESPTLFVRVDAGSKGDLENDPRFV